MRTFILTCCSTADLPLSYYRERDIPFACFRYTMDGKEYPDDVGQTMPLAEFYQRINGGAMPTTSQVNAAEFIEFFEPMLAAGNDVLHLSLSSGITATFNSVSLAKEELKKKYPDRNVYAVDTLAASAGYGLLVDAVADLRDAGASVAEAYEWVEANKLRVHHWFFTTDLSHLKRGGRVSASAATLGALLNICPLLNVSRDGKLIPRSKARGKKGVMNQMLARMERFAQDGTDYHGRCFISNSACYDDARAVADMVEAKFPRLDGPVRISDIGAVIGAHTGPGTVALFFFGEKRED